jgi:hypothetical protein
MTRIVDRGTDARYPDEYWLEAEAVRVARWPWLWPVLWVAAGVLTVYVLIVVAIVWGT